MSLMRYSSLCAANRWVFHADLKPSVLRAGSRSDSGNEFHSIGPATENARWPNVLRRCRGPVNWWRMADKKRWRLGTSDVRVQQSIRYWGTFFCRHRWTPSLYWTHCGMSSRCSSEWLKFHLARLDSTRLDSTRSTLSSQSSQSRQACRARRAVLFQHGGRRTILYKFNRFYALAYTNPICFIK